MPAALAELLDGSRDVAPERDGRSVGLGGEHPDGGREQLEPVPGELELLDDRAAEPADGVGDPRCREPRCDLGSAQDPAHLAGSLEDRHPPAVLREVGGCDEPVVAGADHDDVGPWSGHAYAALPLSPRLPLRPFSTSSAAIRPGAPMMPPPGWVADPHIHRSRIGVR